MDITALVTAAPYTGREDLQRHIDAQHERAFTLMETAAIQATRTLAAPADFQAPALTAYGQVADVSVLLEAMAVAAQANGEMDLAERLAVAAETADDLLIYLARAATGTLPAHAGGEDEDQGDGVQEDQDLEEDLERAATAAA
jgi:hypothetical protein